MPSVVKNKGIFIPSEYILVSLFAFCMMETASLLPSYSLYKEQLRLSLSNQKLASFPIKTSQPEAELGVESGSLYNPTTMHKTISFTL